MENGIEVAYMWLLMGLVIVVFGYLIHALIRPEKY